jgi:oligopeptide/dipeptide ABC transporter ATP-binding protein
MKIRGNDGDSILSVKDLSVNYYTRRGIVRALQEISFDVEKKKLLGIVGESGSGKSVLALSILNLVEKPGVIEKGTIKYKGRNILELSQKELDKIRGGEISMIFPDPMSGFDPTLTIGVQVTETITRHNKDVKNRMAKEMAIDLFKRVKIPSPEKRFDEFPFMFSGGMIQRVMIALAISSKPEFIIADNPTQALDVTIQAQILELMAELQETLGTTFIFITNSLPILARYADTIMVLYAGITAEIGDKREILNNPSHPYTQGLIDSIPNIKGERQKRLRTIAGFPQDMLRADLERCIFLDRCSCSTERCAREKPRLYPVKGSEDQLAGCFLLS